MNLPTRLNEQLKTLAPEVAAQFHREGWAPAGGSVILGLPLLQWHLRWSNPSGLRTAGGLREVAELTPFFYHQVKLREAAADRVIGSAETILREERLQLAGVGSGPMDEWLAAALSRMPRDPHDMSSLAILTVAAYQVLGLWRQWPDGRGEIWIAEAPAESPFRSGEHLTEAEFLRRLWLAETRSGEPADWRTTACKLAGVGRIPYQPKKAA